MKESSLNKFDRSLQYALQAIGKWEYKNAVDLIMLYGSCARGENHSNSDVDLYIHLDREVPASAMRQLKAGCTPDDYTLPEVDVKIDIWSNLDTDNLFHKELRKDGVILWKK